MPESVAEKIVSQFIHDYRGGPELVHTGLFTIRTPIRSGRWWVHWYPNQETSVGTPSRNFPNVCGTGAEDARNLARALKSLGASVELTMHPERSLAPCGARMK